MKKHLFAIAILLAAIPAITQVPYSALAGVAAMFVCVAILIVDAWPYRWMKPRPIRSFGPSVGALVLIVVCVWWTGYAI